MRQPGKAPNYSVNWTVGCSQPEIIDAMKGKEQVGYLYTLLLLVNKLGQRSDPIKGYLTSELPQVQSPVALCRKKERDQTDQNLKALNKNQSYKTKAISHISMNATITPHF